jgi:hypothetical protein
VENRLAIGQVEAETISTVLSAVHRSCRSVSWLPMSGPLGRGRAAPLSGLAEPLYARGVALERPGGGSSLGSGAL